nr:virion structural protein [Staphylococcus phage S-CoN_Ph37]
MIIKHQLKLHLNELVEYVWKHDIKNKKYSSNNGSYVIFDNGAVTKTYIINKNDLFNIEDEIEITMDSLFLTF